MSRHPVILFTLFTAIALAVGAAVPSPARAADPQPKPLQSGIVSFNDAKANQADWGEMRRQDGR